MNVMRGKAGESARVAYTPGRIEIVYSVPTPHERYDVLISGAAPTDDPLTAAYDQLEAAVTVETDWAGQFSRIRAAQMLILQAKETDGRS